MLASKSISKNLQPFTLQFFLRHVPIWCILVKQFKNVTRNMCLHEKQVKLKLFEIARLAPKPSVQV